MMEQQTRSVDYDAILNKLEEINSKNFSSRVYWQEWEKYLRAENNHSGILTDTAFLIKLANERADGFHFLKARFGDEYGEYIFSQDVLDGALRKSKDNWQHFSDEQQKLFEMQYQFYYGSPAKRQELRLKFQQFQREAEKEAAKDEDVDVPNKKFDTFEAEKENGKSTEEAMQKAKEVEKEDERKEAKSAKENNEETDPKEMENSVTVPERSEEKAEQKEPAQSVSPSDSTPPPSNNASEKGKEEVAETKVAPPTTDTSTKNESEGKEEKVSQNVPLAPAPEANELFQQKILNDHLRHRLQSLEEELLNLKNERKELEEEKGKLKDEKGKAELGSNLQMQSLRSRIERLNLQLTDANKHRTELEENKIQQNLKLDEMTNELNETKKKLLVLENSKQVISEKELCESLQYATTQTSRIVLYCTGLAIASIFLVIFIVIFAFVR